MSQSAEWWRAYRVRRRDALRAYNRERRQQPKVKAQRHASELRRRARIRAQYAPLPLLFPHLQHGAVVSFWEDELRMDLHQERALAQVEGRDPDEAERTYRQREVAWWTFTAPLFERAA